MNIEHNMRSLRLLGMERSWKALVETRRMTELNFEDGLQLLLQSELDSREEKRFDRLKKNAAFRYQASVEELNMDPKRGMDKAQIADLITGVYFGDTGSSPLLVVILS